MPNDSNTTRKKNEFCRRQLQRLSILDQAGHLRYTAEKTRRIRNKYASNFANAKNESNRYSSLNGERQPANTRSWLQRLFGPKTKLYKNSRMSKNAALAKQNRNNRLKEYSNTTLRQYNTNINVYDKVANRLNRSAEELTDTY